MDSLETNVPAPLKYAAISTAALLTTLLCFLLMYALIRTETQRATPVSSPSISVTPSLAVERLMVPPARQRPARFVPAELPPDVEGIPIAPRDVTPLVTTASRPWSAPIVDQAGVEFEPYPPIHDLVPLYVVQPVYPFSAVMREIEGYVVVSFGVRENGSVINPVVTESEPGTLFDEAAIAAITRFRFQPRSVGGDTVSADDLRLRFLFKLENGSGMVSSTNFVRQANQP